MKRSNFKQPDYNSSINPFITPKCVWICLPSEMKCNSSTSIWKPIFISFNERYHFIWRLFLEFFDALGWKMRFSSWKREDYEKMLKCWFNYFILTYQIPLLHYSSNFCFYQNQISWIKILSQYKRMLYYMQPRKKTMRILVQFFSNCCNVKCLQNQIETQKVNLFYYSKM